MANKQINELGSILPSGGVESDYLLPVYNVNSLSSEKVEKSTISEALVPKWNPFTGTRQFPTLTVQDVININLVEIGAPESGPLAKVSAADFIISVVHNGDPSYQYGIWKVGDAVMSDPQADPRDAVVSFNCDDEGSNFVSVGVIDNTGNYNFVNCIVVVQNNDSLVCGG